jgi:hypothetical protein
LPKVIGSVASLALESIAIGFKIPAQKLDKILGNQSPGFILSAIGYGLHAVSNVINNIFVHDFYNQIGSVSYEEEERFLYANLAAHSSAELRKKTGELMTKPADEEKIKAVVPSSTFYAANDFDKIPSFNPHAALKITFSDGVGVPHLANYSNSEGKSSWRIESGDDSLTLAAIQAKITTVTANSAFSGFNLPDTSSLDDSQQKNIALMHYAMLIEIKRCGDDKSAVENLKFNFHFKDTGTIGLCQQIASDLKEHTIKSLEARTPKAVAPKQQKAAELGDDPSLMNSVSSTKTPKRTL